MLSKIQSLMIASLNGNRLFFLEPMESSSVQTYIEWIKMCWGYIFQGQDDKIMMARYIEQTQNFVLWHYQFGSKMTHHSGIMPRL